MPKEDGNGREDFQRLEKINGLNVRCFNYNSDIRNKTLIVDRAESLVIEINKEVEDELNIAQEEKILGNSASSSKTKAQREKEINSFNKIIGLSTYSNSRSTVLSYAAMFETLWNETELYEQIKQSHSKLEIANEQLERQYKRQRDFVNIAAHEIRTPTQCILGYAEMLDMEHIGSKEYVFPILRNAERLRRLTEDILCLAKAEGDQTLKLNKERFNLAKVVFSVTQDMINQNGSRSGKRTNVHFVGGSLEEMGSEENDIIIVEADKGKIIQVISNILSNAIRFAKDGDVIISIEIKNDGKNNNSNKEEEAVVSIKDTGTGINLDVLPNLFSKFSVIHETSGNGLGLFISKNIIESHGGRIWAENNTSGKGATFSFSLPIKN